MTLASGKIRDYLLLAVALLSSVFWARGHFALAIDVENTTMRSVGTQQARIEERLATDFGIDSKIVLLVEPEASASAGPQSVPALEAWLAGLRAHPMVRSLQKVKPKAQPDELVVLDVRPDEVGRFAGPTQSILDLARATLPPGLDVHAAGPTVGEMAIASELAAERERIVPAILFCLLLLLLICYQSFVLAIGALIAPLMGVLWTGGIQQALGQALDPVSSLLAPVLLTVGVASSVHVIEKFLVGRRQGLAPAEATAQAVARLIRPAALALLTTIVGFLGLLLSAIPAIGNFGLMAALGVTLTYAFCFVIVPAWLRCTASGKLAALHKDRKRRPLRSRLRLGVCLQRWRKPLLAFAGLLALLFCGAWTRLRVDTEPIRVLPPEHPFRVATNRVADHLGGIETFCLLLLPPHPPYLPAKLAALAGELTQIPGVVSLTGLPGRSASESYRLGALLAPGGSTEREACFQAAESAAQKLGWQEAHAAGNAVQVARDSGALVRGQHKGMALTIAFLWVSMALGFRSWRLATLGLLPNVLPCCLLYGGLAWIDRPLSVASAMIGTVLLGLIVDNTIHFLDAYRQRRNTGSGPRLAVLRGLKSAGRPIVLSSMMLAIGFAAGLVGELETTREFGVLAALTILSSVAANLFVLAPVLLPARRTA